MKVFIVAKTNFDQEVCIGGLTENGQSLRLKEKNGSFPAQSTYSVGEIWEIKAKKPTQIVPPHVETVLVIDRKKVGSEPNIKKRIESLVKSPWEGNITSLYEEKLRFTGNGNGYIEAPNIPSRSTWFWLPDRPLMLDIKHYRYDASHKVKYAGVASPITTIPARTLVRVSLAGWWKPSEADPSFPERCYLQLSGWYL